MSWLRKLLNNPLKPGAVLMRKLGPWIKDDETYLRWYYFFSMRKRLNLKTPSTFNEKVNWLKLHDHNPLYTSLVDKLEAKDYVTKKVGAGHVFPTLGIWHRPEDIEWDALPSRFVLKTTQGGGGIGVIICHDKTKFDKAKAIAKLNSALKQNLYTSSREWPYRDVRPRIFAEPYMEDEHGELRDYKFFCFGGKVKALFIAEDRQGDEETKFDFFDADFHHLDIRNGHPNASVPPEKPLSFEKMKEMAERLSQGIPHLRVDFYEANGKIYFGELTFSHWSGFTPFEPAEWDLRFGQWLELPSKQKTT